MDKTRMQQYMSQMRAMFNKHALYSDESPQYQIPFEPNPGDTVKIRFRTLKNNVDAVYFISGSTRAQMQVGLVRNGFDYYEIEIPVGNEPIRYFFEIQAGRVVCYYNKLGVTRELQEMYSFGIIPGFHTPDWAKGAVMYQIFVDRFCNGDPSNDVLTGEYSYIGEQVNKVDDWNRFPEQMDVRNFYGGDLQGVIDKMDYLQDLGVQVIYLNPVFVSPSNHKYDIQDYDYIDPHFGKIVSDEGDLLWPGDKDNTRATRYIDRVTNRANLEASNELFIHLVEEAHKRGMKVILDGVFNHCGSFNKWLDRERIYEAGKGYEPGAYVAQDSPYHTFFKFYNEHNWPYNEFYDGWWGHDTLPKLNYEGSEKLMEDIMRIGAKWVSPPFNADGWRLDVAADLGHSPEFNHKFWKEFRRVVKEANPEAMTQYYSFCSDLQANMEAVSAAFGQYRTETEGYIRTGIVGYDGAVPVYGVAVGQGLTVTDVDGETVVDQNNFRATFTAQRLSFWQDANEVAYVSNNRLYITNITVLGGIDVGQWSMEAAEGGLAFRWIGG